MRLMIELLLTNYYNLIEIFKKWFDYTRWKYAEASIKLHTTPRDAKDSNIISKINDVMRDILDRFSSDPKRKIIKNSKK